MITLIFIIFFVILKLTGVATLSWWWIFWPILVDIIWMGGLVFYGKFTAWQEKQDLLRVEKKAGGWPVKQDRAPMEDQDRTRQTEQDRARQEERWDRAWQEKQDQLRLKKKAVRGRRKK